MGSVKKVENFCCRLAQEYFSNRNFALLEELLDERITVIGTGAHEISRNREELLTALKKEAASCPDRFIIDDQWYQVTDLHHNLFLAMGEIKVKQDVDSLLEYSFTTRITIVLEYENEKFKIIHFHQSIPDHNQRDDEFFPHEIIEKSRQELEKQIKKRTKELEISNQQVMYNLKHDYLTGILNRHYIENSINQIFSKYNYGLFLIIDIDYFKKINDNYGHPFGDKVLVMLSKVMQDNFGINNCGRIGGDEFVAFLESNIANYQELTKRVNEFKKDWDQKITKLNCNDKISISIGISYYPAHGNDFMKLLTNADIALYQSKKLGRNLISVFNNSSHF